MEFPASLIQKGDLVAFPTETVYGLGANALDEKAVAKIFKTKGRPADNPLIVHIAHMSQLNDIAWVKEEFYPLYHHFWPGPITFIFKKKDCIPAIVSGGLDTVAVRIPAHPAARALIESAGVPIAAPSANISGRPSPTSAEMVFNDLKGKISIIIDGGACEFGLESTVVDLSGAIPRILRPGVVTSKDLRPFLQEIADCAGENDKAVRSPGMKYRHYKPDVEIVLVKDKNNLPGFLKANAAQKIVYLSLDPKPLKNVTVIGFTDAAHFSQGLYQQFFIQEQAGTELILIDAVSEEGVGKALMNRILKACDQVI